MRATNRLAAFAKAMSWQLTIASNGLWSDCDSQSPPARERGRNKNGRLRARFRLEQRL
jgi:hypothetical protein